MAFFQQQKSIFRKSVGFEILLNIWNLGYSVIDAIYIWLKFPNRKETRKVIISVPTYRILKIDKLKWIVNENKWNHKSIDMK